MAARQWELNVMAPLRFMRETAPLMAEQGHGPIVNVSSSAGKRPGLANAAYSVTKSAEFSLSRVWADAYASRGVLVNAVAPGPVSSPLWMGDGGLAAQSAAREGVSAQAAVEGMRARIPVGRLRTEEEVADVIAFLCSDRASFVAGSAWSVDGGYVPSSPRQDGAAAGAVASGRLGKVAGACACSWVAGVGPVEPHTEVADHE